MEVTAAERNITYTEAQSLAQKINNYILANRSSIANVAKSIGYSRTTVSRYLAGKYDSDPTDLENKLAEFLAHETGEAVEVSAPAQEPGAKTGQTPVFYESRDAKAVLGVCQSCQEYIGLGIVVARSGYGKTYALRQYAKLPRVAYIECDDTMSSRDLVEAIERSLGLPSGYGTIWRRVNGIREFFNTNRGLPPHHRRGGQAGLQVHPEEDGDTPGNLRPERRRPCDRRRAEAGGPDQDLPRPHGEPRGLLRLAPGADPVRG